MTDNIRWSTRTLEELEQLYWDEIAPTLRRNGLDPHTRPSFQTLADHGYSGLAYTLREHHDLTPKQFLSGVVGLEDDRDDESSDYDWTIEHDRTQSAFESYLRSLDRRRNLADSTLTSKRTHLAAYAEIYRDLHGTDDLLAPLDSHDQRGDEIDRAYAVLDVFDAERSTDASKIEYTATVASWYDRLVRHGRAEFNPLEHATKEFGWEREDPDNHPLEPSDVQALYQTAESLADRLLVVALAGWGLRSGEVARLHQRQFVGPNSDDPHLDFEERKNGPSSVSLLYGLDVLKDRWNILAEDETWNGYLFPSSQSDSGHIAQNTVRNRFQSLAADAGVQVQGKQPKPHMARRFWYTAYQQATANLLDRLEGIAADQGSASAEVVAQNYLSNEELRQARRDAMREKLAEAFGGVEDAAV